jgi:hypothetical protein
MATESSVGTVTQARIPAIFTVPPAVSTPLPAAVIVKTDTASILQDTLQRMENMFAGTIYQNMHGGAYTLPQQYAAPPPQGYTTSAVPSSTSLRPEQKCHFNGCPQMIRDCPGTVDYINRGLCKRDPTNNWIGLDSTLDNG